MSYKISVIITAKDRNDPKLKDLEVSLDNQSYRNFEKIIVTEGDSESAKAIGLKRAKGQIVCILASDNYLVYTHYFQRAIALFEKVPEIIGAFPTRYYHYPQDDILNRYFSLFGVNDPIPLYLHKNDKMPYYIDLGDETYDYTWEFDRVLTFGDNGFFFRKDILMQADIEHYFHIDVCQDLFDKGYKKYGLINMVIWHRTGGNILKFFIKRFRYADKFSKGRRWKMVTKKDIPNLLWFIFCTLTLVQPLYLSVKGYRKIKDKAWFLHLPVCLITLGVYGLLCLKLALSAVHSSAQKA